MMRHVIFAGGGTGGHLFPGLAVAAELAGLLPDVRITFAGSGAVFEQRLVEAAGFHYLSLPCRPLPRSAWQALQFVGGNARGCWQAGRLLHHLRASAVVGLGGFASVPVARAAIAADVPLVLLEQNACPGRATRWLAPGARLICTAFELPPVSLCPGGAVRLTGNPIRPGFQSSRPTPWAVAERGPNRWELTSGNRALTGDGPRRGPATLRLVVLGGSQGARPLNRFVPRALRKLKPLLRGWEIIHQCGPRDQRATQAFYARLGLSVYVRPFISDMAELLSHADLAISRAGGTTLAELAAAGVPAVLAPYPFATDDHQRRNASAYVEAGGCITVEQDGPDGRFDDRLAVALAPLLGNPQLRERMSAAMERRARPDAAWRIATLVAEIAQSLQRSFAA